MEITAPKELSILTSLFFFINAVTQLKNVIHCNSLKVKLNFLLPDQKSE